MRNNSQGYRHFDLPVDLLEKSGNWVPLKESDPEIINKLKAAPSGTLIVWLQATGSNVLAELLTEIDTVKDQDKNTLRVLAAAALCTSWYNVAEGATTVMRRRMELPVFNNPAQDNTATVLSTAITAQLYAAADTAGLLADCVEGKSAAVGGFERTYGKSVGVAALQLAALPYSAHIDFNSANEQERQHWARQGALQARSDARDLRSDLGVYPSVAQLAKPFSPLSVHIQRAGNVQSAAGLTRAQATVL